MSAERYTLDTNILVYAVDPSEGWKHEAAATIVDGSIVRPCILTLQALAEFVAVAFRGRMKSRADAILQARDWLTLFPVVAADARALDAAFTAAEAGRFGLFDALLLATARAAGCSVILSENMRDGGTFDGIAVRNPLVEGGIPQDLRALLGMG